MVLSLAEIAPVSCWRVTRVCDWSFASLSALAARYVWRCSRRFRWSAAVWGFPRPRVCLDVRIWSRIDCFVCCALVSLRRFGLCVAARASQRALVCCSAACCWVRGLVLVIVGVVG